MTHAQAARESALARWVDARPLGARTAELFGGAVSAHLVGWTARPSLDPDGAVVEVRLHARPPAASTSLLIVASARSVRRLAKRLFGGPEELDAPRPVTVAESACWTLAVAAAIADLTIAAEAWPKPSSQIAALAARGAFEILVQGAPRGGVDVGPLSVHVFVPEDLVVRIPPPRPVPTWSFDVPVILGSCAIPRSEVTRLELRDVITGFAPPPAALRGPPGPAITVARRLVLRVGDAEAELRATPGAVEAEVVTGYGARDMPPDAHTVELGSTKLTLRQLADLGPGQIIPLSRPLSGPFDVRAGGRLLGQGELVDVDGELGVRIVSLQE